MTRSSIGLDDVLLPSLQMWVHSIAENKKLLGRRYSEWSVGGPTLEASVALSAMTQDELGHSRVLYGLLEELAGQRASGDADWTIEGWALRVLERPWPSWAHVVGAIVFLDTALTVMLEAASASVFTPLQRRVRKMLDEEKYHQIYGVQWLLRLGTLPAVEPVLRDWCRHIIIDVLGWYGPSGEWQSLANAGVLDTDADGLHKRYIERIRPYAEWIKIHPETMSVPWEQWDPTFHRLRPTSP